jgi:hypothetical protein
MQTRIIVTATLSLDGQHAETIEQNPTLERCGVGEPRGVASRSDLSLDDDITPLV